MLSISDIKRHSFAFQKGGKFYESVEVDSFFADVVETLDTLTAAYEKAKKENDELVRKMTVLSGKVDDYRKDEDNIRSALLIAQRAAESVINEARNEANNIVGKAKTDAEEATTAADEYVAEKKAEIDSYLVRVRTDYDEAISEAESKAALIISEAETKASEILTKANADAEAVTAYAEDKVAINQKKIASMKKITAEFKTGVIDVMNQQIRLLESIDVEAIDVGEVLSDSEEETEEVTDEVYHPEYTSEEFNAEIEEAEETEDETEEAAEEDGDDASDDGYNDVIAEDDEIEEDEEVEEETDSDDDEVNDYFDEIVDSEPEQKKAPQNVFTPIMDSDEQAYHKSEEILSDDGEEDLRFGKDYDIFEEEDDSQGSFFGRFKKK